MDTDERKVMETASATTSTDNANSGSFAYVIFGVTTALILAFSLAAAGCASAVLTIAGQMSSTTFLDDVDESDLDELFDHYLEDLEDLGGSDTSGTSITDTDERSVSVADALDLNLAPYTQTLDAHVPASAYSDLPTSVRDFCRTLVTCDADLADQVSDALDAAARDETNPAPHLAEARELCASAKTTLDALEIPAFEETIGTEVRDLLGSAKGEASRRFDLISAEIALLETDDDVDMSDLEDADEEVVKAAEKAGELVCDAMDTARGK